MKMVTGNDVGEGVMATDKMLVVKETAMTMATGDADGDGKGNGDDDKR